MGHVVEHRLVALMPDASQHRQGIECDASCQLVAVEVAQVAACSPTPDDDNEVEVMVWGGKNLFEGTDDACGHLFALHDCREKLYVEVEAVVVLLKLIAEVAVTCCRSAAYDCDSPEQPRQRQALVVVEDAVFFELHENLASALCEVAQGESRIDVEDIERESVLLMEVDLDQQLHLQSLPKHLATLLLEAKPQDVVVPCPASDARSCHDAVALLVLLDKFSVEVASEGWCADIAQFAHHPIGVVEARLDDLVHQVVQLEKCKRLVRHSLALFSGHKGTKNSGKKKEE